MNFLTAWKQVALNRLESANNRIKGGQTSFHFPLVSFQSGTDLHFFKVCPSFIHLFFQGLSLFIFILLFSQNAKSDKIIIIYATRYPRASLQRKG